MRASLLFSSERTSSRTNICRSDPWLQKVPDGQALLLPLLLCWLRL